MEGLPQPIPIPIAKARKLAKHSIGRQTSRKKGTPYLNAGVSKNKR